MDSVLTLTRLIDSGRAVHVWEVQLGAGETVRPPTAPNLPDFPVSQVSLVAAHGADVEGPSK